MTSPFHRESLYDLDDTIPGPSVRRLAVAVAERTSPSWQPRRSLSVSDRDVFRPLQYCAAAFEADDLDWRARGVVEMSGLHLEALVKRIGPFTRLPLGIGVRRLKENLGAVAPQVERYVALYNDAKHQFDHEFGTHMFSISDAVHAYIISRVLGFSLYSRAQLKSDWRLDETA